MVGKPKIGIIALTLELYESLAPGLRENRQQWLETDVLPRLREKMYISFEQAVFTREGIERAIETYERQRVDGIIVICLTYSPSELALPSLSRTRLPIMVWNTQELWSADESFSSSDMTNNHGVHGTQDLCSVLCRHGVKFQYVTSHMRDANALDAVAGFAAAAAAVKKLRTAKVGRLGGAFPHMGDFAVDSTFLANTLGSQIITLSFEELFRLCGNAPTEAISQLVKDYQASYAVAADITPEELEQTARMELAFRRMIKDKGLSAVTYLFSAFSDYDCSPTLPFVAACRLMADGVGFGGEGDVIGALGNYLLNELQSPASFSEIFTADFRGNSLIMSHMGEADTRMASGKIEMTARPMPIAKTVYRQLALRFTFVSGEATLLALVQSGNEKWRMIVSAMDLIEWQPAKDIPCPQFRLAPRADVRDWLTGYAKAGGPHHNAICIGDARLKLKMAAEMLGAEYVEI